MTSVCTLRTNIVGGILLLIICARLVAGQAPTDTWHNVYEPNTSNNNFKLNNTPPAVNTALWTNGNQHIDLNVSKVPIRALTDGFTGQIYAHLLPWFDGQSHLSPGYISSDANLVDAQITDMLSRGLDGVIINWYGDVDTGGNPLFTDQVTKTWRDRINARGLGSTFVLGLMIDKGAIKNFPDPTVRLNHLIHDYIVPTYENAMGNAFMRDGSGNPILYFFDVQQDFTIDWASVRYWASPASGVSTHVFLYEGSNGFTVDANQADGAFAWIDARTSGSPTSFDYLSWWYGLNRNGRISVGSAYKGFDDAPVQCWQPGSGCVRLVNQLCGTTWLDSFRALRNTPSVTNTIQLATWNDYEEGTALEVGIDNCLDSVNIGSNGSVVSWSLSWSGGDISTIHHFTLWARASDGTTMYNCSGDLPTSQTSFDLNNAAIPAGTYQIYVQAVGQPFIKNILSAVPSPVTYTR